MTPTAESKEDETMAGKSETNEQRPERLRTWKLTERDGGLVLMLNGKPYALGSSADALAFDLSRATGVTP